MIGRVVNRGDSDDVRASRRVGELGWDAGYWVWRGEVAKRRAGKIRAIRMYGEDLMLPRIMKGKVVQ